jgi:hypothetical protein
MPKRRSSRSASTPGHRAAALRAALLLAAVAALLGACLPPQAHYSVGLGTSRISGYLLADPAQPAPGGPLVVIYLYHHQFVNYADGSAVLLTSARVVRPGRHGDFSIDVPADVVRMDILFIAPGHLTELYHFQRQLGVGDIDYRTTLKSMPDWRAHYYTFLSPQLQELIVEPRYRLAPAEQQVLVDWMQEQDARLGSPAAHR